MVLRVRSLSIYAEEVCILLMNLNCSKAVFKGHNINCRGEKRSQILKRYEQRAQHEAAAQEGPVLSAADPQASCQAPVCLRDAAPAPALPCSPQVTRQHRSFLHTRLVLSTAGMHPSLLLLLGGREYDSGRRWPRMKEIYISPSP